MKNLVIVSCAILLLTGGCAGHFARSYGRWESLANGKDAFSVWAQCIDKRSWAYLDRENPAAPPLWYKGPRSNGNQELFTWVLADCADKMTGLEWDYMPPDKYERIIGDAYQHFYNISAQIQAYEDMKTI